MQTKILWDILSDAFLALVLAGCAASLLVGIGLLLKPDAMMRLSRNCNRWVALPKLENLLNRRHAVERTLYRHHRITGVVVLVFSLYNLYVLLFDTHAQAALALLRRASVNTGWLFDALEAMLVAGNIFAAGVGVFIAVRPSILRNFEAWANRWVSAETPRQNSDMAYDAPDRFAIGHIRPVAIAIIAGSLFTLIVFWRYLVP